MKLSKLAAKYIAKGIRRGSLYEYLTMELWSERDRYRYREEGWRGAVANIAALKEALREVNRPGYTWDSFSCPAAFTESVEKLSCKVSETAGIKPVWGEYS